MSAITSPNQVCNLAVSSLGNRNSVMDIANPKTDKEIQCAIWYDIVRQNCLKTNMPNFAITRIITSAKTVPDGYVNMYGFAYEKPQRCLKLLGVGNITEKNAIDYIVEGNLILTNTPYPSGIPLRIIDDIVDVSSMSPEFILLFAAELRARVAMAITQDKDKEELAMKAATNEKMNATALNAQENTPVRVSNSRFRQSRFGYISQNPSKN